MKILLIPFFFLAAALTANAHCGTCGTDGTHDVKAKSAEKQSCGMAEACGDKKDYADKKACAEKKDCSPAEAKACADKSEKVSVSKDKVAAKAKPELPMPKMSCCAKDA